MAWLVKSLFYQVCWRTLLGCIVTPCQRDRIHPHPGSAHSRQAFWRHFSADGVAYSEHQFTLTLLQLESQ